MRYCRCSHRKLLPIEIPIAYADGFDVRGLDQCRVFSPRGRRNRHAAGFLDKLPMQQRLMAAVRRGVALWSLVLF